MPEIAGNPSDRPYIIVDPYALENTEGYKMGYLRSIPYLLTQGAETYTFPPGWLSYRSDETRNYVLTEQNSHFIYDGVPGIEFDYHIINEDITNPGLGLDVICQVTHQEIQHNNTANVTETLVRAYQRGHLDHLVLVVASDTFRINSWSADKPLSEELGAYVLSYNDMLEQYIQKHYDSPPLPFNVSRNLWLQEAAHEYRAASDRQPTSIDALFEFDSVPPTVRTWDVLEFMADPLSEESADHVEAVTRPWVETNNTVIRKNIMNTLGALDYDESKVREYRSEW
jgi:hypothetical protein